MKRDTKSTRTTFTLYITELGFDWFFCGASLSHPMSFRSPILESSVTFPSVPYAFNYGLHLLRHVTGSIGCKPVSL
jgi:hypothetical protein